MQREVAEIVEAVHRVQPIRHAELLQTTSHSSMREILDKPITEHSVTLLLSDPGRPLSPAARRTVLKAVEAAAHRAGYRLTSKKPGLYASFERNAGEKFGPYLSAYFVKAGNQRARRLEISATSHLGDPELFRTVVRKLGIG